MSDPEGSRKASDKEGLTEKRETPSIYAGTTARSMKERSSEHWADAESRKEECHIIEHQVMAHQGKGTPTFNFKGVKKCTNSLERQVREAIRIQMIGVVLNKKVTYNRCKLTRLVVDTEWEGKVWKDSWVPRMSKGKYIFHEANNIPNIVRLFHLRRKVISSANQSAVQFTLRGRWLSSPVHRRRSPSASPPSSPL